MDIMKEMGIDKIKATDGVWVLFDDREGDHEVAESELGPSDAAIKIARADNLRYQRALSKRLQPLIMKTRKRVLDPAVRHRAEAEALYDNVIVDWRNLKCNGVDFPYSMENVVKIWTDVEFSAFKERIAILINDEELFRIEMDEETIKN